MKKIFLFGILFLTSACNMPASTPEVETTPTQTPLPAPTIVSVTPSLVPTETAVPTPEPPPLYFSDEFDTSTPYWEFMQAGGVAAPVTNISEGALRIDIAASDTWLIGIHNVHGYLNVFVSAQTSISPSGSTGLICRYSAEDGWYEFNASPNGDYNLLLGQWLSPGIVKYLPIISDVSNQLTGNAANEIGLFCEDNFLQLYVNDVMIRRVEVTNYGLREGKIGITTASFGDVPVSALFESITVSDE